MRSKILAVGLFISGLITQSAFAQSQSILPHVANGVFHGGSFRTTFILVNNTNSAATAILSLTNDNGEPLEITILGFGIQSTFTLTLTPGATRILQTDGRGNLVTGTATITSTANISVSGIFTVFDPGGNFVTESGVGDSRLLRDFVIPVDTTGTYNTGLALFSPQGGTVTMALTDAAGRITRTTTLSLSGNAHIARFITDLFPSATDFRGTLVVQSSADVAAMVLRQSLAGQKLSYTSLPVVARSSTQQVFNLAQIADGGFAGGQFRTSLMLFNLSTSPANVTASFTRDDGSPLVVTIPGQGTGSTTTLQIPAGGAVTMQTDGSGPLAAGAATISANVPIGVSAVFTLLDAQGNLLTETGAGDSPAMTEFTLPVDVTGNFDTGIAFYNPSNSAVTLSSRLLDANGGVGGTSQLTLEPKGHTARFASSIFPGIGNFRGSAAVSATGKIVALVLRQSLPAGTPHYTSLPVKSGVSQGTIATPGTALLPKTETGVAATSDVTLNVTLPAGFKLMGKVDGGFAYNVTAQSGENVYSAEVESPSGKYLIVVPAGSYALKAGYYLSTVPSQNADTTWVVGTADAGSVQISGDTTKDIALPEVKLFSVSGTIAGLGTLPTDKVTSRRLRLVSADKTVTSFIYLLDAGGAWQGLLPTGTFTARLDMTDVSVSSGQIQQLSLSDVGSVTVSGGSATANLTVPLTAILSGNVTLSGEPRGRDTDVFASSDEAGAGKATTNVMGKYRIIVAKGRAYSVGTQIGDWIDIWGTRAISFFPSEGNALKITGDTNFDLTIPELPRTVVLSGKVTDAGGHPVPDAEVFASSGYITGAQGVGFKTIAYTDASGNYRIPVLSGTNYSVTFAPPVLKP